MDKTERNDLGWLLSALLVGFLWTLPFWMMAWGWV